MQHLTELELIALKSITASDFYEAGRDSIPWDYSVLEVCPLKGRTRSGAFGSLAKKGLIDVTEKTPMFVLDDNGNKIRNKYYSREGNFGTISISEAGYALLDSLKLIDANGYFIEQN
jgi:hypothetical protein